MVGGDAAAFADLRPIFDIVGSRAVLQGAAGAGQHTKMVNQIVIASTMVGACEGLIYARKSGLDPDTVLESISAGAAGSWTLDNLVPRMIRGDFEPGFFIQHFVKDLGIALDEAARMQLELPGLKQAAALYDIAVEQGLGAKGTQGLLKVLET